MVRVLTKFEKKRRKFLLRNHNLLTFLYPNTQSIYGPYLSKDGRYRVVFYDGKSRKTRQYAKVKMEIKLERLLKNKETVDHIDDNPRNDKYDNLQVISLIENAKKAYATGASSTKGIIKYSRSKRGRRKSRDRLRYSNPVSKFTQKDVIWCRKQYAKNKITINDIILKFRVTRRSVENMLKRRSYAYI